MSEVLVLADYRRRGRRVSFNRNELNQILAIYSERVACGEWKDYAIDLGSGMAVFFVFRSAAERPAFAIVKRASAGREGGYALFSGPRKVKGGKTIREVLSVFRPRLRLITPIAVATD